MTTNTQARAPLRALVSAAVIGSMGVLAVGGAYMGGSLANAMTVKAKAERLAGAEDASEQSLIAAAGGLDHSALAIARRHDPYTVAGGAARDRQSTGLAGRLERRQAASDPKLRKASLTMTSTAAAPAFRMAGALDSTRDLDCLAQAVYYEARGEGLAGMRAVAQVVLNRARHPAFPKTVCGVVYQGAAKRVGCQFSFTCDGSMRRRKEPGAWRRAQDVAAKAMAGAVMAEVGTATHFHTTGVSPRWRHQLMRVAQVGTHVFYRFGGRNGSTESFRYTPRPSTGVDSFQPVHASMVPLPSSDGDAPYKILFAGLGGAEEASKAETAPAAGPAPAARPVAEPAPVKPVQPAVRAEPRPEKPKPAPAAPAEAPAQPAPAAPAAE